jgi:hypothetical protein
MNRGLFALLAIGAAVGYFLYTRKEPLPTTPASGPLLEGMGRRIHKPEDYQLASFIVGLNAAKASTRNQNISRRAKRILDGIRLPGGKKIQVDGKNNIYIGSKYDAKSKSEWDKYVSDQAAILAYRSDDYYPKKPPVYSSLSTAKFRERFKKAPESVYKTKWAPKNKKLKARQA